jgi:glucokinase
VATDHESREAYACAKTDFIEGIVAAALAGGYPRELRESLFVVVSGLPGSGKTTLARQLAPALGLPLIDKDDILERLFEQRGIGDAAWRRALSRESDLVLQREAAASTGAVLTSMWHVPGMAADSGTPTGWLRELSHLVVEVVCVCAPEIAARRFVERRRHPGHLDDSTTLAVVMDRLRVHARLGALDIGPRVGVDTSGDVKIDAVIREIRGAVRDSGDDRFPVLRSP